MSNCDIITSPITFLGASVLSFNSSLGLGSSESTLNVDLIEDCETDPPQKFQPKVGTIGVGAPVLFKAGIFEFGGVLTNWTVSQGGSGKTFNAKVSDPRQLLENCVVITDSYLGTPLKSNNYFNVYNEMEGQVLNGNCNVFGASLSSERGTPYKKVIESLIRMDPTIYSPTGYTFSVDFTTFPQNLPEYYRISGPSITILGLLQDVCDVMGFEFYVYMDIGFTPSLVPKGIIKIGLIDLKTPPSSFSNIVCAYDSYATDLSYGQELRNEVTKTVIFGEYQHYLSEVTKFNYFFGEDLYGNTYLPVVPYKYDACGFWIKKKVDSLNLSLRKPLPSNGPYTLHELDIRAAMASQDLWRERVMSDSINGSFNAAVRNNWPESRTDHRGILETLKNRSDSLQASQDANPTVDAANNPNGGARAGNKPSYIEDLDRVWNFVKSLGDTYYGKQFITPLNQKICYKQNADNPAEILFSDIPTNAGGWVDGDQDVLGLADPELEFFRENDGRISCFALFNLEGNFQELPPDKSGTIGQSAAEGPYVGDVNTPTNPFV